ncbi:MAG: hypothetical protein IJA58_00155 [Lachnospiraceae bacterium]|nr:hypothetical protein [Lachnospiraceae bacterium]
MVEQVFHQKLKRDVQHNLEARGRHGRVEIVQIVKHNDMKLTGMVFLREGGNVSPIVNLDLMYEDYKNGKPYSTLMQEAYSVLMEVRGRKISGLTVDRYEDLKDKIRIRMCNPKQNEEWLKDKVHKPAGEFVCTYYAELFDEGSSMAAKAVTHENLEEWGISEETLIRDAEENLRQMPILMRDVEDIMLDVFFEENGQNLYHLPREKWKSLNGLVYAISNESRVYGASVLARDDVLKRLGEMFGANYYVLPSTVHDILAIPLSHGNLSIERFFHFVKTASEELIKPEERLSDAVLLYDRKQERLFDAQQYYREKLGYDSRKTKDHDREKQNDEGAR